MAGPLKKYAFINAKLRARISKMISEDLFNQMIKAGSLTQSLQLLSNTPFSIVETIYSETGDLRMGELELFKKEIYAYKEMENYVQNEVLETVKALLARFEIENLKNAVRLWFDQKIRGRNIEVACGYLYRDKIQYSFSVDRIVNAENIENIAVELENTPYAEIIRTGGKNITDSATLFPLEIALDHFFYRQLNNAISGLTPKDRETAKRLLGVEIDLQNLQWITRFKSFYDLPVKEVLDYIIPYGSSIDKKFVSSVYTAQKGSDIMRDLLKKKYSAWQIILTDGPGESHTGLSVISSILDSILENEVHHVLAGYPFTIGIILAYFILKGNEIKKIMTILNAKYYNLDEDNIKGLI